MSPRGRVAQLYPQTPGSLYIAFYASQGYGGGISTHLHIGHIIKFTIVKCRHSRILRTEDHFMKFMSFSLREGSLFSIQNNVV
jgi:hypothetical protein